VRCSFLENAEFNETTTESANELIGDTKSIGEMFDREMEIAAFFDFCLLRKATGDLEQLALGFGVECIEGLPFAGRETGVSLSSSPTLYFIEFF